MKDSVMKFTNSKIRIYARALLLFAIFSMPVFAAQSAEEGLLALITGSFAAGLFLTFTPCVLPMVPILSSIIVGQGEEVTKRRAFLLSFSYVLGTAVTYAVMGALAGATGEQLQSYFENVWAISLVSLIFVVMALSMFGLFTIQLPASVQSKLSTASGGIKGGKVVTVFLLGLISALIIGACVSPILIAFLGVAIAKGSAILGAVTMFFMALGMGVPLLLIGVGMGQLLPKAGEWMDLVKNIFGVLLLATAIYFFNTLELISPLLVWGIFLIVLSIYLGALEPLGEKQRAGWRKLLKGVGVVSLVWGILLLIGAAFGEKDLLHPLPKTSFVSTTVQKNFPAERKFPFDEVDSLQTLQKKLHEAQKADKMAVIFFSNDFCGSCKKYKATTFKDPAVIDFLGKEYVALHVNMTDKSDTKRQAIRKKFKVFGPPTFVFFDREGNEIEGNRIYGYQTPEEFLDMLEMMAE